MHERSPHSPSTPIGPAEALRRAARTLHRAAHSGGLAAAMPALRRIHAAGLFPDRSLSLLYRERQVLKRKHFLRALAIEMGFPDWERMLPHLDEVPSEALEQFEPPGPSFGRLNLWFSSEAQAQAYALDRGGRVLRMGTQAMVVEENRL